MNNKGRIVWGIGFITVAVFLILSQLDLITADISVWNGMIGLLCTAMLVSSVMSRSFEGIFFSIGLAWLTFDEVLGLPEIGVFPMILIIVLLIVGFNLIFPQKNKNHWNYGGHEDWSSYEQGNQNGEHQKVTDEEQNGYINCSNRFGALAKYVNCADFKGASLCNSFGELKVYLDQANIVSGPVEVRVSNSFGKLELYIPREWNVNKQVNVFAGEVTQKQKNEGMGQKQLIITGNVSFGEIEIIFV